MRKIGIITLCLLAIYGLARAADVTNIFQMPATTCSSQFIRSIATITGAGTCASVNFATDGTGLVPLANGGTNSANTTAGSWTPADASGAALTFTAVSAGYSVYGNMVYAYGTVTYPSTVNASASAISGLPINTANQGYSRACSLVFTTATTAALSFVVPLQNSGTINFFTSSGGGSTNAQLSLANIKFICIYPQT